MSEKKSESPSNSVGTDHLASSSRFRERLSITSTPLNGKNYAVWARAVEVYYVGQKCYHYLTDDPPAATATTYETWVSEDANIRSDLWNSMEEHIASTLVFLPTAKQVWTQAQEMYFGVNNLCRTYDLHQSFFSISQGDLSLEAYYSKFRGICEELNICEPISSDVKVMRRQRERMQVARLISGASSTYGPVLNHLLGSRDLPSLSEVFSRIRQSSVSVSAPPPDRSALTSVVSGTSFSRGRGRGCGRGRESGFNSRVRDSGFSGRGSGRGFGGHDSSMGNCGSGIGGFGRAFGGRMSGGGNRGRGRDSRSCTHCGGTNHTVDTCYDLHGFPQAHQAAIFEDAEPFPHPTDSMVTISAEEYQRLVSNQTSSSTVTLAQTSPSVACVAFSHSSTYWVIDSDASDHMTGTSTIFSSRRSSSSVSPYQQHCRLGHPSLQNLKRLVPSFSHVKDLQCEVCEFSKHRRVSFYPRVERRVSRPFQLVHSDIWGPIHVPTLAGFQYYVIFVDDFSRVTYLYLMKTRSELSSVFKSFYAEIKTQFDTCIRIFRSDNAREYFHNALSRFFDDHGIIHQSSCARTPQQNGVAERKIRHLSEVMRAMLIQMQVPKSYWSDAVLTTCYLINFMPSTVLGGQIPHDVLFSDVPPTPMPPLQVYVRQRKRLTAPPVPTVAPPPSLDPASPPPPPPPLPFPPSPDLPIALRKGIRSCTTHLITQFVSYNHLSPSLRTFTTSVSSIFVPNTV
ncbi:uncharacterized protein LOC131329730 [Rhododendron vialii]|uniref:uncharacterized protein LOC131329730 n=1 Tax=Rhododendron vialii TaxID=182163 RepID=UPI00265E443B|nr:uncharacterized protein LOC131329730 [Rhododendron vialii]